MGFGHGLGEAVMLGFCKGFPGKTVGYIASGTGFAGMFGTFSLLSMQGIGLSNGTIFIVVMPTIIIYISSYLWLNH